MNDFVSLKQKKKKDFELATGRHKEQLHAKIRIFAGS